MFFGAQNLSDIYSNFSRSFNGDYILADSKLVANEEGNIKSLELLSQLYKEGVFPPESFTATAQEVLNYMSHGRAVFTVTSAANVERLNNASTGNYAGKVPYAPLLQSWSIVMPKNLPAERKKITWSFIKNLVSRDSITRQALNGNGPPRISTIKDPRAANIPYMEYFAKGLQYGRVHVPHIVNAVRINDLFVQASQAAILGREPIKKAMDDAVARAKPLV
jgi:multiple sugar transport system substrate-binding protein